MVAGLIEEMARVEQRLAGDAADVETGATEIGVLLDAGHLQPELTRADRGDVAAGSRADDDEVEGSVSHSGFRQVRKGGAQAPRSRRAGSSRVSFTRTRNVTAPFPSTMRWS